MYKSFPSLFSPDSLANVEVQWAKEVKHFCKGVPVILVGNKIDLRGDQEMTESLAKKDQVRKKVILQSSRKIDLKIRSQISDKSISNLICYRSQ